MQSFRSLTITTLTATAIGLGLTGAAAAGPEADGMLRIGGSTTLLPIIAKTASDFMERYKTWNRVDPALIKKDVVIFVSGGGSGFGVRSTINGTVHIGLASRNIKAREKRLLGPHKTYLVGKDAVVIAANKANPLARAVEGFDSARLARIFSGAAATYRDIDPGLPARKVVLLVRDSGAGSAEMMQKLILRDRRISPAALQLPSQGALLRKLETNTHAIGYISSGLVLSSKMLKGFKLEGVQPTNDNVINGSYKLVRPLLMVVKGTPGPMARSFIYYVLSPDGQKTVAAHYYVPAGTSMAKLR